jgi:hypothetical protein
MPQSRIKLVKTRAVKLPQENSLMVAFASTLGIAIVLASFVAAGLVAWLTPDPKPAAA